MKLVYDTFEELVAAWHAAAESHAEAADAYRKGSAQALLASDDKSADRRAARAELSTGQLKLDMDVWRIEERALYYMIQFELNRAKAARLEVPEGS